MTKLTVPRSADAILRRLTLRELRLLLAVSRAGSILKAAEDVGLTQPAVSRAIADLEDTIGVRLFDRTNRGVEETPQGRILLDRTRGVFEEMRLALEEIDAVADATVGDVRIGGTPAMCGGLLAHAVFLIVAARPGVRHQVQEMEAGRLASAIRARSLDLALGREPATQADGEIGFEKLFDDHMFVVAGQRHPLASQRRVLPRHLADQRWLLPDAESQTYRQVDVALRRHGVLLPPTAVTSMSILMRYQLLRTGGFITAMHGSALRHCRLPAIRVLPIELDAVIPVGLSRLKGRTLAPAAEAFAEVLREIFASMRSLSVRELNLALGAATSG